MEELQQKDTVEGRKKVNPAVIITGVAVLTAVAVVSVFLGKSLSSGNTPVSTPVNRSVLHQVTVRGEGEAYAVPDQASFSIDIKGSGETSEDALTETNRLVKMVRTRLHDNNVDQKYIKTEDISTYPEISYELDDKGTVNGYKAYTTISVKDIDIKTAEKAYGAVNRLDTDNDDEDSASSYISVNSLSTNVSDEDKIYDRAVKKAIRNARDKADTISKESGMKVAGVINVSEYEDDDTSAAGGYSNDMITDTTSNNTSSVSEEDGSVSVSNPKISAGREKRYVDIKMTFEVK